MTKQLLNIDKSSIQDALNILKKVREQVSTNAVIAGGYIRDVFYGRKPKDIDIFIPFEEPGFIDVQMHRMHAKELIGAKYMPQCEVTRIWDVPVHNPMNIIQYPCVYLGSEIPVQIIMLAPGLTIEERIAEYDFGICQCWTDGSGIYATEHFMQDYLTSSCTLVYCEDDVQYARSMRRWDRLKQKFPEKTLEYSASTAKFKNNIIW